MKEEMGPSTAFLCLVVIMAISSSLANRLLCYLRKDNVNGSLSNKKKVSVVFILGCTGSGKSTQSKNIVTQFGYTHLSTGALLRQVAKSGSEYGNEIQKIMNEGKLVPTDDTLKVLLKAMKESENDKFIVDGFPREEENRTAFESKTRIVPEFVLFLDCPEEELERRVKERNEGRADDSADTIPKRLKVFKENTLPVIEHYDSMGKVHKIDAGRPAEDVFNDIKRVFSQHGVEATSQ